MQPEFQPNVTNDFVIVYNYQPTINDVLCEYNLDLLCINKK